MANKYATPKSAKSLATAKPEDVIPNPNDFPKDLSAGQKVDFASLSFKEGVNQADALANLQYVQNSKAIGEDHRGKALAYLINLWGGKQSGSAGAGKQASGGQIQNFQELARKGKGTESKSTVEDFQQKAGVNP